MIPAPPPVRPLASLRGAFVYRPGDGLAYAWDGCTPVADVFAEDWRTRPQRTYSIPVNCPARTAETFMRVVDAWRQAQQQRKG